MEEKDVKCPACGTINKSLFLEETEGNYECVRCGYCGTIEGYGRKVIIIRGAEYGNEPTRLTPLTV